MPLESAREYVFCRRQFKSSTNAPCMDIQCGWERDGGKKQEELKVLSARRQSHSTAQHRIQRYQGALFHNGESPNLSTQLVWTHAQKHICATYGSFNHIFLE